MVYIRVLSILGPGLLSDGTDGPDGVCRGTFGGIQKRKFPTREAWEEKKNPWWVRDHGIHLDLAGPASDISFGSLAQQKRMAIGNRHSLPLSIPFLHAGGGWECSRNLGAIGFNARDKF